jgi:hypothetical protein
MNSSQALGQGDRRMADVVMDLDVKYHELQKLQQSVIELQSMFIFLKELTSRQSKDFVLHQDCSLGL